VLCGWESLKLDAELPKITADRVQLGQILIKLMLNGIDAMRNVDGTRELAIHLLKHVAAGRETVALKTWKAQKM
jgi:C4-dicarboxylate-specific signal transduction histidine kinase